VTTYKELTGVLIKRQTTNPSDPLQGQVWYNNTDGNLKGLSFLEAFTSATPMPVAKSTYHRAGTMTAGLFCAGNASTGFTTTTEEWNGVGFSQGGEIGTALYSNTGFGTQTAGASAAGRPTNGSSGDTNACFEYDGSTWTSVNAANLAARTRQSFGIQTAGAMVGGFQQTTAAYTNATEEYDGTNWTTVTAMPANAGSANCMGTQTAAIVGLGGAPTTVSTYIAYDGTNWTTSPSSNIARARSAAGGTGATNTAGLVFGGAPYSPTASATAETWDGTSFTNSPASLTTARYGAGISDGNTNGIMVGGYQGTAFQSAVEEFNASFNTITAAAWAAGGNLNTARARAGGMLGSDSTQNASMAFGGQAGTAVQNKNEEYNGTSWAESGDLGTARRWHYGAGSQTAALCAGGVTSAAASPVVGNTEEYDGSSWSEVTNMGTGRYNGGSGGIQTAAFVTGGSPAPSYTDATEEYDGTNWTAGGAMLVSKGYYGGGGTLTAGIVMGMSTGSKSSYEYDGSSWTAGGTMVRGGSQSTYAGLQTDGISFGGTPTTLTEGYDGTAWSTRPSMGTARYALAGKSGTSTSALGCGGEVTPQTNATEEFTGETTAVNVKTLTQS